MDCILLHASIPYLISRDNKHARAWFWFRRLDYSSRLLTGRTTGWSCNARSCNGRARQARTTTPGKPRRNEGTRGDSHGAGATQGTTGQTGATPAATSRARRSGPTGRAQRRRDRRGQGGDEPRPGPTATAPPTRARASDRAPNRQEKETNLVLEGSHRGYQVGREVGNGRSTTYSTGPIFELRMSTSNL